MSQSADILAHLRRGNAITPLDALRMFGVLRLASRVEELRRAGHQIDAQLVSKRGKRVARYSMRQGR